MGYGNKHRVPSFSPDVSLGLVACYCVSCFALSELVAIVHTIFSLFLEAFSCGNNGDHPSQ